jgi:hypothetical protein
MGADGEPPVELAVAEDLDARGGTIGEPERAEGVGIDTGAVVEAVEGLEVDGQIAGGVAGVIEAAFGDAADQRHLTAFEAYADGAAGAGSLALAATSAGLSVAAGFTLTKAFTAVFGAGTGFEVVEAHKRHG